jgi:hypothetical protein
MRWDWRNGIFWAIWAAAVMTGCATLEHKTPVTASLPPLPNKREIRVPPYVFITDVDLKEDHPLLKELQTLQDDVSKELQLPPIRDVVKVYLFNERGQYDQYMQAHFRNLPPRRAFFMANIHEGRGDELVVYTSWGDRVQEDLRHECTHALLHGVLKDVPMWLDEGLAEYFEVPPSFQGLNYRHLKALRTQSGTPWMPNLSRLEELTQIQDMTPGDYRESWAWVHWMMRSRETRTVLINYLQQFRTNKENGRLKPLLAAVTPAPDAALRRHLDQLESSTRALTMP